MVKAGFTYHNLNNHSFFIANSIDVDTSKIEVRGMTRESDHLSLDCSKNKLIYILS